MTELIANGYSKSRSAYLTGISRSMIYYEHRKRKNNTMLIWRNAFLM